MKTIYGKLKKSKEGRTPTWDSLLPYVLEQICLSSTPINRTTIKGNTLAYLELPEEVITEEFESGNGNKIQNRLDFALSRLNMTGLVKKVSRAIYSPTALGMRLYKTYGDQLTNEIIIREIDTPVLTETPKKKESENLKSTQKEVIKKTDNVQNSIETIEETISALEREQKDLLLKTILESSPYFFERLVVKLLSKMGYRGTNGRSVNTKMSHDGGIDGIINQDPLGTQTVYIQAKRYNSKNTIKKPEIQRFYGALRDINAQRGVFITTSSFTKGAIDSASRFSIILIDGNSLLDLLIKHNIGIEIDRSYFIYKLDEEFFER